MCLTAYLLSATPTFDIAANVKIQAEKFAICFAIGIAFGAIALLYFRRSSRSETFVTDLFATLAVGAGFIICYLFILASKFELYALVAYLLGAAVVPAIFKASKAIIAKRKRLRS